MQQDNLNRLTSSSLTVPFGKMNSMTRLDMAASAMKHTVVPSDPDFPYVDSAYTNDILFSTDDKYETGGVRLISKIPKIINGIVCEHCYIYETLDTGEVKLVVVPTYEKAYKFGCPTTSHFENMNEGDVKQGKVYVKHYRHLDTENNIVSFGKNVNFIYDITGDVGEDAVVITKELANAFSRPFLDTVEINISSDYILRNLYGTDEEYKPLPIPGDIIKDGLVASMYIDDSKSFLAYDDNIILDSDNKYYIQFNQGARVVDMEIYSKDPITRIPILEKYRQEYLSYMKKIVEAITNVIGKYPKSKIHYSLDNLRDKYSLIINGAELGVNMQEMRSNIVVRITTVKDEPAQIGDKISGRHGNKGTVSKVMGDDDTGGTITGFMDKPLIAKDGDKEVEIHGIFNLTGVMNRENPAQLTEAGLMCLWLHVQRYLETSNDTNKTKLNNIVSWLRYAKQPQSAEFLSKQDPKEVVEYYKKNYMCLTYYPYDNPDEPEIYMDFKNVFKELTRYTNTLYQTKPWDIYENGVKIGTPHYVHNMFFVILSNGPYKDTSIRGVDGTNSKGNPTKSDKDKKKFKTKYGTTGVKMSDFALNIFLNPMFEDDKKLLRNNTLPLHDYLRVLGRELVFTGEGDKNDKD